MEALGIAIPAWTDYRKKSGLDPLGMQNGSINLYQRLIPGISNVTLRVRYYGFYAWLASRYARQFGDTNPKNWQKFIRRAEAVYAMAAQVRGHEGGIAGILWAQDKLQGHGSGPVAFAANADPGGEGRPYLKQAWGAYGAAYASQLFEMGVFAAVEGHSIPVPSDEIGEALSGAFSDSIGDLASPFLSAVETGTVDVTALAEFGALTPSGIAVGGPERQLYQDMLFANGKLQRPDDLSRRSTLLLILQAAGHVKRMPDTNLVRWLCYAGADENGREFAPINSAQSMQCQRWWIYQANDLLHFSYEALLKFCLDLLEAYPAGITLNTFLGEVVSTISEAAPSWPTSWGQFRNEMTLAGNAYASGEPNSERSLVELINQGIGTAHKSTAQAAWAALQLIAILENRSAGRYDAINAELGALNREGFRSLVTERGFLTSGASDEFGRMVARIIEERVIKRHLWVAHRKLRYQGDYTFLIESDNGRIRPRADSGPVFTNPRLGPAVTFLKDIHLVDGNGLTARGAALLGST